MYFVEMNTTSSNGDDDDDVVGDTGDMTQVYI